MGRSVRKAVISVRDNATRREFRCAVWPSDSGANAWVMLTTLSLS